jgi:hypothetical protein
MKQARTRQPNLFDTPKPPSQLPAPQGTKVLALLGALLTEAARPRIGNVGVESQEAGDEQDHG